MSSRRIAALILSLWLPGAAWPAQTPSAGIVLQTSNARINTADAAAGTTLYDGDRLETQSKGVFSARSGDVQLALAEESTLWMNHENALLAPTLQRGTVTFRAESGTGVEIRADDVRVRAHNPVLTVGEVTLEQCTVLVTARTQQLEVTAGRETKILDEGKSMRVARLGACAAARPPLYAASSRFWIIPAALVPIGIWFGHEAFESPDRP